MHDGTATAVERNSLAVKGTLPTGVTFSHQEIEAVTETDDAIVNRIREFTSKGAVLSIAPNAEIAEPIFLNRTSFGTDSAEFSRVLIKAGNHSKSVVVIENSGDTHLAEDLEIVVEPGAHLTLIALQEWDAKTIHAARHHAIIDRDATFKSIVVTVGGDVVRLLQPLISLPQVHHVIFRACTLQLLVNSLNTACLSITRFLMRSPV